MRRLVLVPTLLLAALCPAAAQAHVLSSSTARAEARAYAERLIEHRIGPRARVGSCRRHSVHAVSCAYRIYGSRGYRCGGRVHTASLDHVGSDTVSRVVGDSCR
jgi:hypothetical protein